MHPQRGETSKDTKKKEILVRVSALAVLAAPFCIGSARAQNLNITCKRPIDIGNLIASGCSGKYVISPDGANKNPGCLIVESTAQAGSCQISVTGAPPTKSALVEFTKANFFMRGTHAFTSVKMDTLRMRLRSQTTIATKLTLGVATLGASKVTIDIGGTLDYQDFQSAGSYVGKVSISANFQ